MCRLNLWAYRTSDATLIAQHRILLFSTENRMKIINYRQFLFKNNHTTVIRKQRLLVIACHIYCQEVAGVILFGMHVPQLELKVTGSVRYWSSYLIVAMCHMNSVRRLNSKIGEKIFQTDNWEQEST
jgi:hypothetical protein